MSTREQQRLAKQIKRVVVSINDHIFMFCAVRKCARILELFQRNAYALPSFSHFSHFVAHAWPTSPKACATSTNPHVLVQRSWRCTRGIYSLQSPNVVEGLVKLLHRMTSGRHWVYIWVDVGWMLGGVALPVKCSPRRDNYCQSRHSIRDRLSTTEQSVVTFRISRAAWQMH